MITPQFMARFVRWLRCNGITDIGGDGSVEATGITTDAVNNNLVIVVRGEDSTSGFTYVGASISTIEGWTADQTVVVSNYSGRNWVISYPNVRMSMSVASGSMSYSSTVTATYQKQDVKQSDFGTTDTQITIKEIILAKLLDAITLEVVPMVVVNDVVSSTFVPVTISLGTDTTTGDTITISFSLQV